jgi:hypothetical protein
VKENTMNLSKRSGDKELFSGTIVKENTYNTLFFNIIVYTIKYYKYINNTYCNNKYCNNKIYNKTEDSQKIKFEKFF